MKDDSFNKSDTHVCKLYTYHGNKKTGRMHNLFAKRPNFTLNLYNALQEMP